MKDEFLNMKDVIVKRLQEENELLRSRCSKFFFFFFFFFFFNWYSLHARLNSHYEAWSYKKRKHKKVKAYRKPI